MLVTGAFMTPQTEEQARTESTPSLGEQVRDFAQLHVDLARTELRHGSIRLVLGAVAVGASLFFCGLAIFALEVALFLGLRSFLSDVLAAVVTGLAFILLGALIGRLGLRLLRGVKSVFLPQTRAMVGELFAWRDDKTNS
jgi:uncharacterized membrane protein YqjE